jgi:hypothetical protein
MKYKQKRGNEIQGDLDIFVFRNKENFDGKTTFWNEILIHGNPEGLKSFAKLLLAIAELKQEEVEDEYLPIGEREHYHLRPGVELSKRSVEVIVGRLDAKGTGDYYTRYIPKGKK